MLRASENISAEIIVVDNNSTDGSRSYFKNRFEPVTFLWQKENVGFSRANNLGLHYASGKYVLFLNPDTIVAEDAFEKCVSYFENDASIGAVGVKMVDGTGSFLKESKRGFPGPLTSLYKISGFSTLFPRSAVFARYYLGDKDENTTQEVDVLAGAYLMVRKKVLDETGSFDEDFFMYGEDIDLSYRIQTAGYRNIYIAETSIIHFKGESTKIGSMNYLKLFYGAMSLFVRKHYSGGLATLYTVLIRLAIWGKALLSGVGHLLRDALTKAPNSSNVSALVVSDSKEYHFVRTAMERQGINQHPIGRVSGDDLDQKDSLGHLDHLAELVNRYRAEEIIFCPGTYAVQDIITMMRTLGPAIHYRFHLAGSNSIVGSFGSNIAGEPARIPSAL